MKRVILPVALLFAVGVAQAQDLQERFKKHLYTLASDEFAGREPGTHGDTLAANYIRDEFAKLDGVQLLGNNGFQEFSYEAYRVLAATGNTLKVGKRSYTLGKDFLPSHSSSAGAFQGEVIDLGEGRMYTYEETDIKDKFVIIHLPVLDYPDAATQVRHEREAAKRGAKGVIFVNQPLRNTPARYPSGAILVLKVTSNVARDLQKAKQLEANVNIEMTTEHTFNIVAKIAAPKENNPDGDVLILGAHYDHMGWNEVEGRMQILYGADDNASGTVGIMELANMVSQRRAFLKKDVIIIAFGAEERGLKGSRYYANNPLEPLENVKAMVNIDMMGRMQGKGLTIRGIGTAYEGADLFSSLPNNDQLEIIWEFKGQGPTDYSAFYAKGIPSFSFGTRHHDDYHKPGDRADRINYEGMEMTYNYIANLINRLAFEPLRLTFKKTE